MATAKLTPLKSIRKKCLDCSCEQFKEVELCPVLDCALWPRRFGKRPVKGDPRTDPESDYAEELRHGSSEN